MNKLDFKTVADAALNAADNLLAEWLPGGRYRGHEYFALNPTRADKHLGSFSVNTHSGAWADHATGDAGGDLVALYAYLFTSGKQGDALRAVADRLRIGGFEAVARVEWDGTPKSGGKSSRNSWRPVVPFDEARLNLLSGARAYDFARQGRNEGLRAVYRDADGRPLCVVQRFIDSDGRKSDYPFAWCEGTDGVQQWCTRRVNDPQPLFGLDVLALNTELPVLVVEGEKCKMVADASDLLRGWVVISWLGGCNGWKKADWSPMAGRDVVLWPDCDSQRQKLSKKDEAAGLAAEDMPMLPRLEQPGMKAMLGIAAKLAEMGCRVRLVNTPEPGVWPEGYDIADALQDDEPWADVAALLTESALLPWPLVDDGSAESSLQSPNNECVRAGAHTAKSGGAGADYAEMNGWRDDELADDDDNHSGHLAELLQNYRQVGLKQRVLNVETGEELSRAQLEKVFNKSVVSVWWRHSEKIVMPEFQAEIVKREKKLELLNNYNKFGGMQDRYIYLDGTTDAFDIELDQVVTLAAVKAAHPEHVEDWAKSIGRKTCPRKNLVFEPKLECGVVYDDFGNVKYINEFKGLPVVGTAPKVAYDLDTPISKIIEDFPGCKNIIGLLWHLCKLGGNDGFEWFVNWLACRFRFPEQKPATAVVFISEVQGVGKSTLGDRVLKGLFGDYYVKLNQTALESQFNAPLKNRLLTVFEEISQSDERKNVLGKFKDMITSETIMIEHKGRDAAEYSDYNSFLVFSNDDKAVPIESNDRRFMVFEVKEKFSDNQYLALQEEIDNGGLQHFADFLTALPLQYTASYEKSVIVDTDGNQTTQNKAIRAKFTPHAKPLMTEVKRRMIGLNKPNWELFVDDWWAGELPVPFVSCAVKDLWAVYRSWCDLTNGFPGKKNVFVAGVTKRLGVPLRTNINLRLGGVKKLEVFQVPYDWLKPSEKAKYTPPQTDGVFRGDGGAPTKAAFLGQQVDDFHVAAAQAYARVADL